MTGISLGIWNAYSWQEVLFQVSMIIVVLIIIVLWREKVSKFIDIVINKY